MPYSLSFIFLLLYLLMCHVLPLRATLAQWDLILEPIAQVALKEQVEHKQIAKEEQSSLEPLVLERLKDVLAERYHLNGKVVLTPLVHWNVKLSESDWSIELVNAPQRLMPTTAFNIPPAILQHRCKKINVFEGSREAFFKNFPYNLTTRAKRERKRIYLNWHISL